MEQQNRQLRNRIPPSSGFPSTVARPFDTSFLDGVAFNTNPPPLRSTPLNLYITGAPFPPFPGPLGADPALEPISVSGWGTILV